MWGIWRRSWAQHGLARTPFAKLARVRPRLHPTWACLGNWSPSQRHLVMLGQLGSGPSQVQHAATGNTLATVSHQVGPTERQGNIAQHEASPMPNTSEIACFDDFVLCRPCAPFWSQVGPKLEPSGPELGRSWLKLTPRPCRIEKVTLDDFVPICKTMQNVQITIVRSLFLAPGRS